MKRHLFIVFIAMLLAGCSGWVGGDRGHLVGVQDRPDPVYANHPGMVYVPGGSFTMGPSDEDMAYSHYANSRTVSLSAFYMDETEITNNQYRQFVHWVRDSLARSLLADFNEEYAFFEDESGMPLDPPVLNWEPDINWDGEEERELLFELYLPEQERFFRRREIDTRELIYAYFTIDLQRAARSQENIPRSELIEQHETPVYPDTLAWIRDFTYAYNEPMTQRYFWHPTYDHYPVVGVNWEQATAFNHWRTEYLNRHQDGEHLPHAIKFELPSEAQWEYAARGDRHLSPYPWGGPYMRDSEGCFLANFKPMRGNYTDDGGEHTVIVGHYPPNDYGLYDMAGNAAEWTRDAYDESFHYSSSGLSDLNPDNQYNAAEDDPPALKRKVIRGGSWKDIGYYLQVHARTYEYQDTAKAYIGFRSVRTAPGRDRTDEPAASNVY